MPAPLLSPVLRLLGRAPDARPVLSADAFRALLRRECIRADRTGRELSLLVIDPPARGARRTAAFLLARLRETDEVGRMDGGTVGALLADTPRDGALAVAAETVAALAARGAAPRSHAVFTYPGDWISPGDPTSAVVDADRHPRLREVRGEAVAAAASALAPPIAPHPLWKRAMDVLGALVAILLLSPILIGVALAVRLSSPGPVLFRQPRIGWRGRTFTMLKFRSMYVDAGDEAHAAFLRSLMAGGAAGFKLRADPRVTPVGRVIRRWSLDELPQLFNVLLGDMSLVGPRPEPPYAADGYARWYHRRVLGAKPGITGLWQVRGRSRVSYETMVRMDLRYSRRISPLTDLRLMLETVRAVVSAEGAY